MTTNEFILYAIQIIVVVAIVISTINKIIRTISIAKHRIKKLPTRLASAKKIIQTVAEMDSFPVPKSIGGATNTFLEKIKVDFPDFHYPDAVSSITTFLNEYINIQFNNISSYEKSNIDKNIIYNKNKQEYKKIDNFKINNIAIYNYNKSNYYATIYYKASVGFDADGIRNEKAYDIEYTIQLKNDEMATKQYTCDNCGAALSSDNMKCPYCDIDIIRDTIMSWKIMNIKEI